LNFRADYAIFIATGFETGMHTRKRTMITAERRRPGLLVIHTQAIPAGRLPAQIHSDTDAHTAAEWIRPVAYPDFKQATDSALSQVCPSTP